MISVWPLRARTVIPPKRGGVSGSYLAFDDKPVARRDMRLLNTADEVAVWVWGLRITQVI